MSNKIFRFLSKNTFCVIWKAEKNFSLLFLILFPQVGSIELSYEAEAIMFPLQKAERLRRKCNLTHN